MTIVEDAERVEKRPATTARERRLAEAEEFIRKVRELPNGERAELRRSNGIPLWEAVRNCPWFYRLIAPLGFVDEEAHFLVASLLADNRAKRQSEQPDGDFGESLQRLAQASKSGGVERRMRSLLDADFDPRTGQGGLRYHLRQLVVRMLATRPQIPINWPQLLVDVRAWNSPDKYVQRRWAKSYYGAIDETEADSKPKSDTGRP